MPDASGVARIRGRAGRLGLVGDEQHLGIIRVPVLRSVLVKVELAETAAERDVLRRRQALPAKQQDAVIEESVIDLAELRLVDARQVNAHHFRTEAIRQSSQL